MAVHADSLSCHTCKALSVCIVPGPAHFIRHVMGRTGIFMPAGGASRRFCAFGRHCHIAGHIGTVRLLVAVAAFVYTPVLSIAPVCACHRDVCAMTVRTFCHRTIIANRCYRHQQCRQQKNGQQALQDSLVHRVPPLNFWVVRSARCSAFPLFYRGGGTLSSGFAQFCRFTEFDRQKLLFFTKRRTPTVSMDSLVKKASSAGIFHAPRANLQKIHAKPG